MGRLTVQVDEDVLGRARDYAQEHGTSVNQLVQSFLDLLSRSSPGPGNADLPVGGGAARAEGPRHARALRRHGRNVIRFPAKPPTRRV